MFVKALSMVWIRWKDVYVCQAGEIQKTFFFFFFKLRQLSSFFIFINEKWKKSYMYCLVIKVSWGDHAAVVFSVTYKFMSSCV